MLFGRRKKNKDAEERPATIKEAMAQAEEPEVEITEAPAGENSADPVEASAAAEEAADQAPAPSSQQAETPQTTELGSGPKDVSEIASTKGYLDFGAILVPAAKDQKVRLDIDQKTKRVVSLTIGVGQASIQLQAFSAPKSGGIWEDVRRQIESSVVKQKGRVKQVEGRFGQELHARVPTVLKDGRQGWRAARFIGHEGNRWFLRGVIGGRGAIDRSAAEGVEDLFSRIVVVRGDEPLPPRELLRLRPPAGAKRVVVPRKAQGGGTAAGTNGVPQARKPDTSQ